MVYAGVAAVGDQLERGSDGESVPGAPRGAPEPKWVPWAAVAFWLALALAVFLSAPAYLGLAFDLPGLGLTAAKLTFLTTALWVVPATAGVGYWFGGPRRADRVRFGVSVLFLGALGVALGGLVAKLLYPDYPFRGPHEAITSSFAAPGLLLPIVYLARRMGRRASLPIALATVTFAAVTTCSYSEAALDLEAALPLSATNIARLQHQDIQDFGNYYVRAHITAEQFEQYVKRLGLSKETTTFSCVPGPFEALAWPGGIPVGEWPAPEGEREVWKLDETTRMSDEVQYPTGRSGCVTLATYYQGVVLACQRCDWGI